MYFSPEAEFTKLQFLILGSITNQRQAEQQWENNVIVTAQHTVSFPKYVLVDSTPFPPESL